MLSPLSPHHGVGFTSTEPLDDKLVKGFRYAPVPLGSVTHHNYHFTPTEFEWPESDAPIQARIDGFSPNLNKNLHIGHLRNLVLGSSLVKVTGTKEKPVAMLGASLGIIDGALEKLQKWYKLARYAPDIYMDVDLIPEGYDYKDFADGVGEQAGCKVTHGPDPVVVRKSNGQSAYAMHDLMFANKVKPTHYVTGCEQESHFKSIGMAEKHLPMGLVVGEDGKKLRSRDGSGFAAADALQMIQNSLKEGSSPELAWNVIAWNFLSVKRTQNASFIPKLWTNPDRGGLYIAYTYARVKSALEKAGHEEPVLFEPHPIYDEVDLPLLGMANYVPFYLKRARTEMDPCPIAIYAFDLAKRLGKTLEQRRVIGGSHSYHCSLWSANRTLGYCMELLTMYPLSKV